jgi:hypothetical protein
MEVMEAGCREIEGMGQELSEVGDRLSFGTDDGIHGSQVRIDPGAVKDGNATDRESAN